jgi:putative membrane protein
MWIRKGSCIEAPDSRTVKRVLHARMLACVGSVVGLVLLVGLALRADFAALGQLWSLAGRSLLWLVPYRGFYFLCFALGWRLLLKPYSQADDLSLGYLWWVSSVREAVDRLLPVASVGGGIVGVRLLAWRDVSRVQASASVVVEVILTLSASYLFAALGVILMVKLAGISPAQRPTLTALAMTLPIPITCFLLLRHGHWFGRLERLLGSMIGFDCGADRGAALDIELRRALSRGSALLQAGALQFAAMVSSSFEIWLVLRLFGHPVDAVTAFILESATQAVRHLAFFIPGGLGAQEAALVLFGGLFGIDADTALAVSLAKRLREVLCGVPSLISWQWLEARRMRQVARIPF